MEQTRYGISRSRVGALALFAAALVSAAEPEVGEAQGYAALPEQPPLRAAHARVIHADTPVFLAGRRGATRRGTLALDTVLPVRGRVRGTGCSSGVWVRLAVPEGVGVVSASASAPAPDESVVYACSSDLETTRDPVVTERFPSLGADELLPYQYAFIRVDGARTFSHPSDYFTDDYFSALGTGFGVVIVGGQRYEGMNFARTRRGLFIAQSDLRAALGSAFAGVQLEISADAAEEEPGAEGAAFLAWAKRDRVAVHATRGGRVLRQAGHRTVFQVRALHRRWVETVSGEFVRRNQLHVAEREPRPESLGESATWLDLDVSTQVLVAYRGDAPVFATLVSSGRGGRSHATPLGLHRIWVKLAFSDMDNLESDYVDQNYAIERVPWVQYFEGSNGLHAAFWHDSFGRRRSHGCINLSPRDARTLFEFSEPALPAGFTAIFPRDSEPTTYVQVRR